MEQRESLMRLAIEQAQRALALNEVPIGCVIVDRSSGRIIGQGYNRREVDRDPTAHAEVLALRAAAQTLGGWRLVDCAVVVTLEPCAMCAGAIVNARVPELIYGCADPKAGAVRTLYRICDDPRLNHRLTIHAGVLADECGGLLTNFFRVQRGLGKK